MTLLIIYGGGVHQSTGLAAKTALLELRWALFSWVTLLIIYGGGPQA